MNTATKELTLAKPEDLMDDETVIVHGTKDYGRFKVNELNRPIDPDLLDDLIVSIREMNRLRAFPIVCNSKMEVTDGQHRLRAAQALGLMIYYIIDDKMKVEDAPRISRVRKNWPIEEYLRFWVAKGNSEYIILKVFWERNNHLTLHTVADMCMGGSHTIRLLDRMAFGDFKANNLPYAQKVAQMILDFEPWVDFYNSRSFVAAVRSLAVNPTYSHGRMMKKMKSHGHKMGKRGTTKEYYVLFNQIYNMNVQKENKVWLEPKR